MNKHIQKIVNDPMPECSVRGHRVHATITSTGENWPKWSRLAYGIAGGFLHFEKEEDYNDWIGFQKPKAVVEDFHHEDVEVGGRCVPECGPIGFKAA
jgi:hypothetical protein